MPKTTVYADLYCYGDPVAKGLWSGVRLDYILNQVEADPQAKSIILIAQDAYRVSLAVEIAQNPEIIIAYEMDGQPLSEVLRLVLPGQNGHLWIALIESITIATDEPYSPQLEPEPIKPQSYNTPKPDEKQDYKQNQVPTNPTIPPENILPPAEEVTNPQEPSQKQVALSTENYHYAIILVSAISAMFVLTYYLKRKYSLITQT